MNQNGLRALTLLAAAGTASCPLTLTAQDCVEPAPTFDRVQFDVPSSTGEFSYLLGLHVSVAAGQGATDANQMVFAWSDAPLETVQLAGGEQCNDPEVKDLLYFVLMNRFDEFGSPLDPVDPLDPQDHEVITPRSEEGCYWHLMSGLASQRPPSGIGEFFPSSDIRLSYLTGWVPEQLSGPSACTTSDRADATGTQPMLTAPTLLTKSDDDSNVCEATSVSVAYSENHSLRVGYLGTGYPNQLWYAFDDSTTPITLASCSIQNNQCTDVFTSPDVSAANDDEFVTVWGEWRTSLVGPPSGEDSIWMARISATNGASIPINLIDLTTIPHTEEGHVTPIGNAPDFAIGPTVAAWPDGSFAISYSDDTSRMVRVYTDAAIPVLVREVTIDDQRSLPHTVLVTGDSYSDPGAQVVVVHEVECPGFAITPAFSVFNVHAHPSVTKFRCAYNLRETQSPFDWRISHPAVHPAIIRPDGKLVATMWIGQGGPDLTLDPSDIQAVLTEVVCPADLDLDGTSGIADVLVFQSLWSANDPKADWDGDGLFTILDLVAFQADLTACNS